MPLPYKNYNRGQLYDLIEMQCNAAGMEHYLPRCMQACYDKRWLPQVDFNGCSVVQDELHPYPPCFLHDYAYVVHGGGPDADKQFYVDLIDWGMKPSKAMRWYIGVRIGWLFYFKWRKMFAD